MIREDLYQISQALRDLRFIQASSIVALRLKDSKATKEYMANLNALQEKVEKEMNEC